MCASCAAVHRVIPFFITEWRSPPLITVIHARKREFLSPGSSRSLMEDDMTPLHRCASCNVRSGPASTVLVHNHSQQCQAALRQYVLWKHYDCERLHVLTYRYIYRISDWTGVLGSAQLNHFGYRLPYTLSFMGSNPGHSYYGETMLTWNLCIYPINWQITWASA